MRLPSSCSFSLRSRVWEHAQPLLAASAVKGLGDPGDLKSLNVEQAAAGSPGRACAVATPGNNCASPASIRRASFAI